MNFKQLFSGVLAMVLAASTVFAFSGKLTAENGSYWHPTEGCKPIDAPGCPEEEEELCEMEINGQNRQIYKSADQQNPGCTVPLFRLVQ